MDKVELSTNPLIHNHETAKRLTALTRLISSYALNRGDVIARDAHTWQTRINYHLQSLLDEPLDKNALPPERAAKEQHG